MVDFTGNSVNVAIISLIIGIPEEALVLLLECPLSLPILPVCFEWFFSE